MGREGEKGGKGMGEGMLVTLGCMDIFSPSPLSLLSLPPAVPSQILRTRKKPVKPNVRGQRWMRGGGEKWLHMLEEVRLTQVA